MNGDQINGILEMAASIFILNHCRVLEKDKAVKGISILSVVFFTLYGIFNIFYYPSIAQWVSFWAGLFIVVVNFLYLWMVLKYKFFYK